MPEPVSFVLGAVLLIAALALAARWYDDAGDRSAPRASVIWAMSGAERDRRLGLVELSEDDAGARCAPVGSVRVLRGGRDGRDGAA
jgi:hypothetical protein